LCNRHRCEEFAHQGCKVYATSRRIETIADFSNESIEKLALDVTSDESVHNALNFILEKEGRIDVVVNNAGVTAPGNSPSNRSGQYSTKFLFEGPLIDQSLKSVKRLFDTNTFAILRICKVAVPIMAKQQSGTIVNIGSIMGNMLVTLH